MNTSCFTTLSGKEKKQKGKKIEYVYKMAKCFSVIYLKLHLTSTGSKVKTVARLI
jgi:hypothetical protein